LIELGHVRFRFIPAGAAFAPNEEEAMAMLSAGVSPPARVTDVPVAPQRSGRHAAEDGGAAAPEDGLPRGGVDLPLGAAGDPSNAATVTDTPIGVLWGSEPLAARLEPSLRTEPNEARPIPPDALRTQEVPQPAPLANVPMPVSVPPRAAAPSRPAADAHGAPQ